jgi:hypothetical protein
MRLLLTIILLFHLSACSLIPTPPEPEVRMSYTPSLSEQGLHFYAQRIVKQLTSAMHVKNLSYSANSSQSGNLPAIAGAIAVGTFLPSTHLDAIRLTETDEQQVGLQVQDSLQVLMVQKGFKVIEFKATKNILVRNNQDKMLTRELNDIKTNISIEYYLTGTILRQEDAYMINAKLINTKTQQVIAGATDYIPANVFWSDEKVLIKRGQLYRSDY